MFHLLFHKFLWVFPIFPLVFLPVSYFRSYANFLLNCVGTIETLTVQRISRPPWTREDRLWCVNHNVASILAPRSKRNLVIREISMGRCPTILPRVSHIFIANESKWLFFFFSMRQIQRLVNFRLPISSIIMVTSCGCIERVHDFKIRFVVLI